MYVVIMELYGILEAKCLYNRCAEIIEVWIIEGPLYSECISDIQCVSGKWRKLLLSTYSVHTYMYVLHTHRI